MDGEAINIANRGKLMINNSSKFISHMIFYFAKASYRLLLELLKSVIQTRFVEVPIFHKVIQKVGKIRNITRIINNAYFLAKCSAN